MTDVAAIWAQCRDLLPEPMRVVGADEDEADTALRIIAAMAVVIMVGDPDRTLPRLRHVAASFTALADELDGDTPAQK